MRQFRLFTYLSFKISLRVLMVQGVPPGLLTTKALFSDKLMIFLKLSLLEDLFLRSEL